MTRNKQTVEKYMEAFRRSDHEGVLACLTEDVEWLLPGVFHLTGKAAFDGEIENDAFIGRPDITVTRLTEENDVVTAEGAVRANRRDGGTLHAVFCDVFEMRNGKIRRLISYLMEVPSGTPEDASPSRTARGSFDVKLTPQQPGAPLGRMSIEKTFTGDLEGTSEGEMLMWRPQEGEAAAYVAIERVAGTLTGRSGSFALTHRGTMTSSQQRLVVEIVPESATGELAGLRGTMRIDVTNGKHSYELEYELAERE